ncbi:MAG: transglutaminase domain-containing protein [Planctomycetaceae bacterium]|nr:transglutaminase domain-containing protein [Planctomycetaceae bacterium]
MDRRHFLGAACALAGGAVLASRRQAEPEFFTRLPATHSVIPVVGDGKWIWTEPPKNQTGYLEPRSYDLNIGVELQGEGSATGIEASTPVPVAHPEQAIDDVQIDAENCQAKIQTLGEGAAQLVLAAPGIVRGQIVRAVARYRLTLKKQYLAFERDQFPAEQPEPPVEIRKLYLHDSPGIQTSSPLVRKLSAALRAESSQVHPWDLATKFYSWGREHIEPKRGPFIGVVNALRRRTGDCEELAGVFVALCRSIGIPARLVWVPNHNWAEFYLTNDAGQGHWIPAHTSCYSWFGWTGVHELVIQKGDRLSVPYEAKLQRLIADWGQWSGKKPKMRFIADLKPLPPDGQTDDAGPGARSKHESGEWKLAGDHPMQRYMRSG